MLRVKSSKNNTGSANGFFNPDDIATVYAPGISKIEQEYRAWAYKNPGAPVPRQFQQYANQLERYAIIDAISDYRAHEQSEIINAAKIAIDGMLPGYESRRRVEQTIADYIATKIVPLAPDLSKVADKMHACRRHGPIGIYPDGHHVITWDSKCGMSKLCPDESRKEGYRLSEKYIPSVLHFLNSKDTHTMQFAVLTQPNIPIGGLKQAKKDMGKAFSKLQNKFAEIRGALTVQEDPLAIDGQSWNLHLNVLLMVDGFLDWKAVRREWGYNLEIYSEDDMSAITIQHASKKGVQFFDRKQIIEYAFRELAKYTTKLTGGTEHWSYSDKAAKPITQWPPELFLEWFRANHPRFRRTIGYGVLHQPYKYRWNSAGAQQRIDWLTAANLTKDLRSKRWAPAPARKGQQQDRSAALDAKQRQAITAVMRDPAAPKRDITTAQWVGRIKMDSRRATVTYGWRPPASKMNQYSFDLFDLILGDKSDLQKPTHGPPNGDYDGVTGARSPPNSLRNKSDF